MSREESKGEPELIARGWDEYAREWESYGFDDHEIRHLGDEWTAESDGSSETPYGIRADEIAEFENFITSTLLDPYLPVAAKQGMEIGSGGGRITKLLLPRTELLHVVEGSQEMLNRLRLRFRDNSNIRYHLGDGATLPNLAPASIDYVIAFDVFVHFEARLVYWYLRQIARLLRPGGVGIIHYANSVTPIGWRRFELDVEDNLRGRASFAAFGVMCPELMGKFLEALPLETLSVDVGVIPRDAIAVFRGPHER